MIRRLLDTPVHPKGHPDPKDQQTGLLISDALYALICLVASGGRILGHIMPRATRFTALDIFHHYRAGRLSVIFHLAAAMSPTSLLCSIRHRAACVP